MKRIDLTGKTFGYLHVISFYKSEKHGCLWRCQCICGKIIPVRGVNLRTKRTKSCGCKTAIMIAKKLRKKTNEAAFNALYGAYKKCAKDRKLDFCLTKKDVRKLTSSNCFYCGSKPRKIRKPTSKKSKNYTYNGIDRVDNNKGYFMKNCVPCCTICNRAKFNLPVRQFKAWINRLVKFRGNT